MKSPLLELQSLCVMFLFFKMTKLRISFFFFKIVVANRLYIEVRDNENSDVSMASFEN
jgi:hypothetical protein